MADPKPIRPRVMDERAYNRALKRAMLDPMMTRIRTGLSASSAAQQLLTAIADATSLSRYEIAYDGLVHEEVLAQAARLESYHEAKLIQTFRTALGVDIRPLLRAPEIAAMMAEWRAQNIGLIRTIPTRLHADLLADISAAQAQAPFDQRAMSKAVAKGGRSASYYLRRITRDQTSKAIGNLTQVRHTQIGVESYRWRTSEDERVRPTHAAKNGQVYRWNSPPPDTGHPGQDIQCRCVAIPAELIAGRPLDDMRPPEPPRPPRSMVDIDADIKKYGETPELMAEWAAYIAEMDAQAAKRRKAKAAIAAMPGPADRRPRKVAAPRRSRRRR